MLEAPAAGLVVTWEATTYADHPAVTWLVTFRDEGSADTPILETVRALDLRAATGAELPVDYVLLDAGACSSCGCKPIQPRA